MTSEQFEKAIKLQQDIEQVRKVVFSLKVPVVEIAFIDCLDQYTNFKVTDEIYLASKEYQEKVIKVYQKQLKELEEQFNQL